MAIATQVFHNRGANKAERLRKRLVTAFELLMNGIRANDARATADASKPAAETPVASAKVEPPRA